MEKLICIFALSLFSCSENIKKTENLVAKNGFDSIPQNSIGKIISDSTNTLENKVQQLELMYISWGCACANWITPKDYAKYQDSSLAKHCIFIEAGNNKFVLPDSFQPTRHRIIVRGQFYVREDYPQGTIQTEENLEKAKVFRYTSLKIIKKSGSK